MRKLHKTSRYFQSKRRAKAGQMYMYEWVTLLTTQPINCSLHSTSASTQKDHIENAYQGPATGSVDELHKQFITAK